MIYITKSVVYNVIAGRKHFVMVFFCDCESSAATLLKLGFWPSSATRPSAAFSLQLMRMLHYLTLECAVSVKGFVQSLRWIHNLSDEEVQGCFIFHLMDDNIIEIFNSANHIAFLILLIG